VGAAAIMPLALALLNAAFPAQQRGRALGIYGSVTGLAAVLGPVLGGVITQGLTWQWIFWLNVPIALAAIPLVLTRIQEGFGPGARLDLLGLGLFTLATFGLVWGLVQANSAGWGSAGVIGPLVAGAAGVLAFLG
jgi:Major Facilitator Superfamily